LEKIDKNSQVRRQLSTKTTERGETARTFENSMTSPSPKQPKTDTRWSAKNTLFSNEDPSMTRRVRGGRMEPGSSLPKESAGLILVLIERARGRGEEGEVVRGRGRRSGLSQRKAQEGWVPQLRRSFSIERTRWSETSSIDKARLKARARAWRERGRTEREADRRGSFRTKGCCRQGSSVVGHYGCTCSSGCETRGGSIRGESWTRG
jgi:hypothetical protein